MKNGPSRDPLCALSIVFAIGACTAPSSTDQSVSAVMGGTTDTTDTGVVGIVLFTNNGVATCSGSLLMPNLVLTARHCVSPMSNETFACQTFTDPSTGTTYQTTTAGAPYPVGNFAVTNDTDITMNGNFVNVAQVYIPPNSTSVPACGKDIALLRLAQPLSGTLMVPRLDSPPLPMEMFTAIGYGATDGSGAGAGERRIRSGLNVLYVGMYTDPMLSIVETQDAEWIGDTGTCSGDSGGPAVDLTGQVMGSVSRGGAMTCDQPVYTRVDSWADFIRMVATDAANRGGTTPPDWVTPPTANTAQFGQPCRSDGECVTGLSCLIVGTQRLCTDEGCNCPTNWICGNTGSGVQACVPDPNAPPPDAGTPDVGVLPADSGSGADSGTSVDAGGPDAGNSGGRHGGCAVRPYGTPSRGGWLVVAAMGALAIRRRRRGDGR